MGEERKKKQVVLPTERMLLMCHWTLVTDIPIKRGNTQQSLSNTVINSDDSKMLQGEGCTLFFHLCLRGQDWSKSVLVQLTTPRVTFLAIWDDFQPAFGMLRFIRCMLNGTRFPLTVLRMCNWGTNSAPSYFAQATPTDTCFGNLFSVLFFQNPNTTCLQGERRWRARQRREE